MQQTGSGNLRHTNQGASVALAPQVVALVLDTNVLLDLWLFVDPRLGVARARIASGLWQCVATERTAAELDLVRQRPFPSKYGALPDLWSPPLALHPPPRQPAPWRCRDKSDQMFLDLAWEQGLALWTRDRDLLALRRRAGLRGLVIETPEAGIHRLAASSTQSADGPN